VKERSSADEDENRRSQANVGDRRRRPACDRLATESHRHHDGQAEGSNRIERNEGVVGPQRDGYREPDRSRADPAIQEMQARGGRADQPHRDDRRGNRDRDVDPECDAIGEGLADDAQEEGQRNKTPGNARIRLGIGGHPGRLRAVESDPPTHAVRLVWRRAR
jgi:hypothetical protein